MTLQLADYEINIRSFHPEKTFGWSGLMFEGDNRGFSLKPSGTEGVTSRIWHKFYLSTKENKVHSKETVSDPSKAPWERAKRVYNGELAPKGRTFLTSRVFPNKHIYQYRMEGQYGGVNHAMPGSPEIQEALDFSYVPTLNVKYKIVIDIDRQNGHMDIVTYITGDGFPNCEAFIVGPGGQAVSLGVHVRKGAAPVSLSLNADYPMIASAIRLPLNNNGSFKGTVGDELFRRTNKQPKLKFQKITDWNYRFISIPANSGHCMLLEKASLKYCFDGLLK
ncbi:hypothetical protein ABMY44_10105 [Pseudoalteromonas sp. Cnat2-41]|uniref:hypothetical protein n=1 Tax=unclassified Pseudoalteromonas TaxID=194690 RepID=UPI001EF754F8|nr:MULTISPECIES: hypothetical protein [unclassified Pseudoalteromonas]MCF2863424.1 hypothetical protein [Pseudoalteromonas sp. CNAT2-18]MCG7558377.1 hypothetical protein [Pseudoalteromonas sp. CNAT2-18.1]